MKICSTLNHEINKYGKVIFCVPSFLYLLQFAIIAYRIIQREKNLRVEYYEKTKYIFEALKNKVKYNYWFSSKPY